MGGAASAADTDTPALDKLLARVEQLEHTLVERIAALEAALVAKDQMIESLQIQVDQARVIGELTAQIIAVQRLNATAIREGAQTLEEKYVIKAPAQKGAPPINQTINSNLAVQGSQSVQGSVTVQGNLTVQGNISGSLAELKTAETFGAQIRAHDLLFGNTSRGIKRNTNLGQGRALVDIDRALVLNAGPDWERTVIGSTTHVNGEIIVNGRITAHGGYFSSDQRFVLQVQNDGNLVLYGPNGPMWASNTRG
jgi:phage baseplate assembly protein gpV